MTTSSNDHSRKEENNTTTTKTKTKTTTIRSSIGDISSIFTDTINNNLIAARYAAFSTVFLLTAYGLSNTPLFFRFRRVSEIPSSYFIKRRRLYGRIIAVKEASSTSATTNKNSNQSIELWIRHLSPVGQILPVQWYDFFMKFSPLAAAETAKKSTRSRMQQIQTTATATATATTTTTTTTSSSSSPSDEDEEIILKSSELLRVKIAGIQSPPTQVPSSSSSSQRQTQILYYKKPEKFLKKLSTDRKIISCQLIARQVPLFSSDSSTSSSEQQQQQDQDQIAICRLYYRPNYLFQFFATDISQSLISTGKANVTESMYNNNNNNNNTNTNTKIIDSSTRISDLRNDVKYLDKLTKLEYDAAKKSIGMWSDKHIRSLYPDIVDEIEFQRKSNIIQKVWRWIRG